MLYYHPFVGKPLNGTFTMIYLLQVPLACFFKPSSTHFVSCLVSRSKGYSIGHHNAIASRASPSITKSTSFSRVSMDSYHVDCPLSGKVAAGPRCSTISRTATWSPSKHRPRYNADFPLSNKGIDGACMPSHIHRATHPTAPSCLYRRNRASSTCNPQSSAHCTPKAIHSPLMPPSAPSQRPQPNRSNVPERPSIQVNADAMLCVHPNICHIRIRIVL